MTIKSDENGRKFSKPVENTVGKGEIARYEQFLLSPRSFKRRVLRTRKNQGLFGKGLWPAITGLDPSSVFLSDH